MNLFRNKQEWLFFKNISSDTLSNQIVSLDPLMMFTKQGQDHRCRKKEKKEQNFGENYPTLQIDLLNEGHLHSQTQSPQNQQQRNPKKLLFSLLEEKYFVKNGCLILLELKQDIKLLKVFDFSNCFDFQLQAEF